MSTIGERVQMIREQADDGSKLTLEKFGNRISLTNQAVSAIEKGRAKPSNSTIDLICREFEINREWLETGVGEMKRPPLDEVAVIVADILDKGEDDPFYKWIIAIIKSYRKLDDKHKEIFRRTLDEL